jgi:hypothetical protein
MVSMLLLLLSCGSDGVGVQLTHPRDATIVATDQPFEVLGEAQARHPEDLLVEWHSSIHGDLFWSDPPDDEGAFQVVFTGMAEGQHVLTVLASDDEGAHATDAIRVYIGDGYREEPSLEVLHPADGERGLEDSDFTFEAKVSDLRDSSSELIVHFSEDGEDLCSSHVDEEGLAECVVFFTEGEYSITAWVVDSDGNESSEDFVLQVVPREYFDSDGDGQAPIEGDCDDENPLTYGGARESCDGIDNDCDEDTPAEVGSDCWDDDGDGFCEEPPCLNTDETESDCDDTIPQINPDATEIPNGYDDDCDGKMDEGTVYYDDDGDGFCELPPCTNAEGEESDCADGEPDIHPDADEVCGDDLDNNCNGEYNERNAEGCEDFFLDEDGDTFGVYGGTRCYCDDGLAPYTGTENTDCYDANPDAHPMQTEWFTEDRGDGTFDYDCSQHDQMRWEGESNGCDAGFLSGIGLQCGIDGVGWLDGEPACGMEGWWLDGCDSEIPYICLAICAATGDLSLCIECGAVCMGVQDRMTQECR